MSYILRVLRHGNRSHRGFYLFSTVEPEPKLELQRKLELKLGLEYVQARSQTLAANSKQLNAKAIGGWAGENEGALPGTSASVSVRVVRAGEAKLREFRPL